MDKVENPKTSKINSARPSTGRRAHNSFRNSEDIRSEKMQETKHRQDARKFSESMERNKAGELTF